MKRSSKSKLDREAHEKEVDRQLERICRGVVEVIPSRDALRERLSRSLSIGQPLRLKAGFDPTAPDLHFGHAVLFQKLSHFQELGHSVTFLIGDFTATIGDPSGMSETRPALTEAQVASHAKTYEQQLRHFLNPDKTTIAFNSAWMRPMSVTQFVHLASQYTVARMLERDDFRTRFQKHRSIGIHEFLYPLVQGYDSVSLGADIELGGTDQKFNLLVGRDLQKQAGQAQQIVITLPLLEGVDGVRKMSKSYGNAIGVEEAPDEMFGKVMSISDELMFRYYELLTDHDLDTVRGLHPMKAKLQLAEECVARFHDAMAAQEARERFDLRFRQHKGSTDQGNSSGVTDEFIIDKSTTLLEALVEAGLAKSKGDARRLIRQGAVDVNDATITELTYQLPKGCALRVKVGKRRFATLLRP